MINYFKYVIYIGFIVALNIYELNLDKKIKSIKKLFK